MAAITLVVLVAVACAPTHTSPDSGLEASIRVDRDASGQRTPVYTFNERNARGDNIVLTVTVSEAAFVYVFSVRADGRVAQVFPSAHDDFGHLRLTVGETLQIPPAGAQYTLSVAPPYGVDIVMALASRQPVDTARLAGVAVQAPPDSFVDVLTDFLARMPEESWSVGTARFRISPR